MSSGPIVTVDQGKLQGRIATTPSGKPFHSFQGIPYAKPPVGNLRFRAPEPAEPWTGVRPATSEGNVTVQFDFMTKKEFRGVEDCLFLNVYSPNLDNANLPVMFFIHGGGFIAGSGNTDLYGPDYFVEKDVVIVTVNYRCGVLGFLSLNTPEVPGNAGMKDIVQALRWVKTNIKNFGGNPDNVTIFGESAGGAAVSYLLVCPFTKNLIQKAIIQSGTALATFAMQKNPFENAKELAKILGCDSTDPEKILEVLRGKSTKELVDAHLVINPPEKLLEKTNAFSVVIEKEFPGVEAIITESFNDLLTSGRVADIPIMIGATTVEFIVPVKINDLQLFIPEEFNIKKDSAESVAIVEKFKELYCKTDDDIDGLSELMSDRFIKVDTNRMVQYLIQVTNKPVYYYNFDYVGALNFYSKVFGQETKRAAHMDELGYLFKNDYQKDVRLTDRDSKVRERMLSLWTNFAKFGNPTPEKNQYLTITWPPVTKDNLFYLNINFELTVGSDIDKEKMDFWNNLYSKYYLIWEHPKTNTDEVSVHQTPVVINNIINQDNKVNGANSGVNKTPAVSRSEVIVSANDPPEDDLPKDIGVNKFVNFFDSLGGKK